MSGKCVDVATDGATAVSGKYSGLLHILKLLYKNVDGLIGAYIENHWQQERCHNYWRLHWLMEWKLLWCIFNVLCEEMGSAHEQATVNSQVC